MNTRTVVLGVVTLLVAGAGAAWFLYFDEDAMFAPAKPKAATPAPKPAPQAAVAPKPEAPKPAAAPDPKDGNAMDQAIKASQAKAGDLEKKVADLQKQVEAKNKEIGEMEKKVAAKK